jgi:hypothetical protein
LEPLLSGASPDVPERRKGTEEGEKLSVWLKASDADNGLSEAFFVNVADPEDDGDCLEEW